jgi:hypothetical protein
VQEYSFEIVRPYVINHLKQHYWKLQTYMDWEDAMSEAQLQFVRTITRLQKRHCKIDNDKHLMSLFKTSWSNHFITLANKATKERFITTTEDVDQQSLQLDSLIAELDNAGVVNQLLQKAPPDVRQVLHILLNAPDELVTVLQAAFHKDPAACNAMLCRLLNKNPHNVNLVQTMLDHLGIEC